MLGRCFGVCVLSNFAFHSFGLGNVGIIYYQSLFLLLTSRVLRRRPLVVLGCRQCAAREHWITPRTPHVRVSVPVESRLSGK